MLYAFSPAGNQKWATASTSMMGAQISDSPAIANEGTVYASVNDDNLYAFNPNGSIRWNVTLGGLAAPPAIGGDGTIYVGTGDKYLYAVNPAGSLKWKTALGGSIVSPMPAIAANGTIYTGCDDYKLYALRPDGSILWSFPTGDAVEATPVIDATGTVFCGSRDGQLYAVKPDGSPAWPVPLSVGDGSDDLAMGGDGIVYVPAGEKLLAVGNRVASPSLTPSSPSPTTSSPSPTPGSFSDLPAAYLAGKEILDLVSRGVLNGYPDGTFRPESPVTRAEFAKMALLSLGLSMVTPPTPAFPDLSPGHWAYAYVEGAVANGLVKGYPDGSYRPEGLVTMAEVFTVIVRAKGWALVNPPPPPPDVLVGELNGAVHLMGTAGDWFDPYLGSAIVNGILLIPDSPQITKPLPGPGPGGTYLLEANMPANRAQTAVFLARM
ncbi:MAG: PQQ-binding-like beta-propeller repeat protein [Coprothermobacterota bacterium]|nr:PQQ-binding-like beta-propeller repeat protein [Coprothermobacterota bacterium]